MIFISIILVVYVLSFFIKKETLNMLYCLGSFSLCVVLTEIMLYSFGYRGAIVAYLCSGSVYCFCAYRLRDNFSLSFSFVLMGLYFYYAAFDLEFIPGQSFTWRNHEFIVVTIHMLIALTYISRNAKRRRFRGLRNRFLQYNKNYRIVVSRKSSESEIRR